MPIGILVMGLSPLLIAWWRGRVSGDKVTVVGEA